MSRILLNHEDYLDSDHNGALKVVFGQLQDFVPFHLVGKNAAYQIPLFRFNNFQLEKIKAQCRYEI